jgi:hypothetical protein
MACPNFKNGLKNGLGPLGVKIGQNLTNDKALTSYLSNMEANI